MTMSTSQKAFKKNIASFISTLEEQGFTLVVSTLYDETETEQKLAEARQAKKQFLLNLDLEVEHNRYTLDDFTWVKTIAYGKKVYAHINIGTNCHIVRMVRIRDIKAHITDDMHGFASKQYRKINVPSAKVLLTRIAEVQDNIIEAVESRNAEKESCKRNIPLIQDEMVRIFGVDAEVAHNPSLGYAIVNYKDVELRCNASTLDMKVRFQAFGQDEVTLEQARDIIDILNP